MIFYAFNAYFSKNGSIYDHYLIIIKQPELKYINLTWVSIMKKLTFNGWQN